MTLRLLAPALAATATLAVAASAHAGAVATCHGLPVTISMTSGTITGTPGRDVVRLTGPGTVVSGAGPDVICGSRFADRIDAGPGDDVVLGGGGHDVLRGGAGRDTLFGEAGHDRLAGGPGRDILHGGAGRNRVVRVVMPRVAGEHGALLGIGNGDVVMSGSYAVSVIADAASLSTMHQAGLRYSLSWLPQAPSPGPLTTVWVSVPPVRTTVVGVGQGTAAYWSESGLLMPDTMLGPTQLRPVALGQSISLNGEPGIGYGFGPPSPSAPGAITIAGGPTLPAQPTLTVGVAQAGNANGALFINPAQVAQGRPNLNIVFGPSRRMRVAVSQSPLAGQVLDPQLPPGQYIDVSLSDASPTAALSHSAGGGFVAG